MAYTIACPEEGFRPQQEIKIYVEKTYSPKVNDFIREHYDHIQTNLGNKRQGLMLYFPMLWEEMPEELIQFLTGKLPEDMQPLNTVEVLHRLWPLETVEQIKGPALLSFSMVYRRSGWSYEFNLTPLSAAGEPNAYLQELAQEPVEVENDDSVEEGSRVIEITHSAEDYASDEEAAEGEQPTYEGLFHPEYWEEEDETMKQVADALAEGHLTEEQEQKLTTLQDNARSLISSGVSIQLIRLLAQSQLEISPLEVTEDYRILLPKFHNMEIPLAALQKAMFICFRNHPEGVNRSDIPAMQDEIYDIYRKTSDKWNIIKLKSNVKEVCDLETGMFDKKMAAMRRQFMARLEKSVAEHYLPEVKA